MGQYPGTWVSFPGIRNYAFSQKCKLGVSKDQFTNEEILTGGLQAVFTAGLLNLSYTNIILTKKGDKYLVGVNRKFYLADKENSQNDITDGSKLFFRFDNEIVIQAIHKGERITPSITYDNITGLFVYIYDGIFEFTKESNTNHF